MSTRTILGSLVLGLLVVACSGEDEDTAAPLEAPAAETEGSSGSPAPSTSPSSSSSSSSSSSGSTPAPVTPVDPTASGMVDKTFGVDGIAEGVPESVTRQLTVDAKGNYLVTGMLIKTRLGFVARYSPEGKLDETLGDAGLLQISMSTMLNTTTITSWSVALPDGSFLVVGGSVTDKGVFASSAKLFDAKGMPVSTFAKNGELTLPGEAMFTHAARLADGSFILTGVQGSAMGTDLMVVKVTAKGELDQTFGTKGITTLSRAGAESSVGLVIDSAKRIVVAGVGTKGSAGFVWRVSAAGKTDPWFGGGVVDTTIGARSISLGKADTILIAGEDLNKHGAVMAISATGAVLPGNEMKDLPSELTTKMSSSFRVAAGDDGLFVVGGWASGAGNGDYDNAFSMQLDPSGKLSSTLPKSGFVSIPTITSAVDVVVSADRAVVLGNTKASGFALTRVWR